MPPSFMSRLLVLLLLLTRCVTAVADLPAAKPMPAAPTVAGDWDTTYGLMHLKQTDKTLEGVYGPGAQKARITGTLADNKFTFTYAEPNTAGEGWFEFAADGASFTGKWREKGAPVWADWVGKRRAGVIDSPDTFTGLWKTSYGRMRLRQTGNAVHGIYDFGIGSNITGTVEGRTLKFAYEQPDGEKGAGTFNLSADGREFAGTWKGGNAGAPMGGAWTGSRVVPTPGRVWLVVLEQNWERDFEEEEYSFGVMLRTFFARVPAVKVRHRFFADEAEFRRWCAELPYLAEPVYLHISSHGDKDGIHTIGGKIIAAQTMADCLRDIGDLRLLHFGTCLVAGGDIPGKIQKLLGESATFPISGYANAADWGGSAVVDFTYFDLMFSRHLSPAEAIEQTKRMLTFAGEHHQEGDAISPAGLVIIEPKPTATAPAK
jgi:hypothetical protein